MTALSVVLLGLVVAQPPKPVLTLDGHSMEVYSVAFSPDGKRLASANNREVKVWDVLNGKEVLNHPTGSSNVYGLAFSPDGKKVALSINKQVRIIDAEKGTVLVTLSTPVNYVFRIAYSPDGKYLAGAGGQNQAMRAGHVHVWDLSASKEILTLEGHPEAVLSVSFSPDSKFLVSGCGGTSVTRPGDVRVWSIPAGKNVAVLKGHSSNVYGACISPDGRRVVSGAGARSGANTGELKLWETASGKEVFKLEGHSAVVYGVAFSQDGRRIVSVSADKTLRVWDALTGKEMTRIDAHTSIVYGLSLHPDGRRVATAGQDRSVKVWNIGGPVRVAAKPLTEQQLNDCWKDLSSDGAPAYRALWAMVEVPDQTVKLLEKHLRPAADLSDEQRQKAIRLVRDLDSRRFAVREAAGAEILKMGEAAIPHLTQAMRVSTSLDLKRRGQQLLDVLTGTAPTAEMVRALRAIEVLEHINNDAARRVLEKLAGGLAGARLTEEAKTSLERMKRAPTTRTIPGKAAPPLAPSHG